MKDETFFRKLLQHIEKTQVELNQLANLSYASEGLKGFIAQIILEGAELKEDVATLASREQKRFGPKSL